MNYNLYHAEDFAADESFIAYYLQTDKQAMAFWENWIAHHPEKLDEIYNAERLLAKLNFRLDEQELQDAFSKFDSFLATTQLVSAEEKPIVKFNFGKYAIAAIVLIAFTFSGYYFYQSKQNQLSYVSYYNGKGKVAAFMLSDGTKISLNSNSTLKYPKIFKGRKREVTLIGEAFFEVAKDKTKPFTVNANGLRTTVLGTKFNVSAYANQANVKVALVEGSVEVATKGGRDKMLLKPTEMATFNPTTGSLNRSAFNTNNVTSWKTGLIIFDNASFTEIAHKMYNTYGIKLLNKTAIKQWNYSGQFDKTDYLTIVKSICFAKHINYKQNNQTIILIK